MRIKTLLVPVLIGTIFLSACKKNAVRLSFTNAKDEVPQLGNLIFRFNQSLVKDSMLNTWILQNISHLNLVSWVSFAGKAPINWFFPRPSH